MNAAQNLDKQVRVALIIVAVLVIVTLLIGCLPTQCSPRHLGETTEAKASMVHAGMTKQQVVGMLGGTDMASEFTNPDYTPGQGGSALLYNLPPDGVVGINFDNEIVTDVTITPPSKILLQEWMR